MARDAIASDIKIGGRQFPTTMLTLTSSCHLFHLFHFIVTILCQYKLCSGVRYAATSSTVDHLDIAHCQTDYGMDLLRNKL